MKIFGERLRDLRKDRGISAKTLALGIGVSDSSIIEWENNKYEVMAINVVKIANYFAVSTDYLLGLED